MSDAQGKEADGTPESDKIEGFSDNPLPGGRISTPNMQESRLREYGCIVHGGAVYNRNGYRICGTMNQHDKPCQRIGHCPFHQSNVPVGAPQQLPAEEMLRESTVYDVINKVDGDPASPQLPPRKVPYKKGWTKEEHFLFLRGLALYGRGAWKQIAAIVSSRTPTQIQSHAQKYFLRQQQRLKNKRSIHDLNLNSPEMMELAAKWNSQQMLHQYPEANGNAMIPGPMLAPHMNNDAVAGHQVHHSATPRGPEAGNPMTGAVVYHSFFQDPQLAHTNPMYSTGNPVASGLQAIVAPHPNGGAVNAPADDNLNQGGSHLISSGEARPASFVITR